MAAHSTSHSASSFLVIVSLAVLVIFTGSSSAKLSTNFYSKSCPKVFSTVQSVVHSAISKQPRQGASLLRLHFHDCLPDEHDAWVLLDYIWSLLSVLISLMLVPIRDPWSSLSLYPVSFNDNDILQCPEVSPDVQHLRVVELGNNVEGNGRDVVVSVGEGDGEGESGGGGGGGGGGGDGAGDGGGGGGGGGGGAGGGDGGGDMNWISKLAKMSIMVTVQTTAASIGSRSCGQHSRIFLDCILVNDLVGYFCCMIAILLAYKNQRVVEILGWIGFTIVAFGFVLLTTMFFVESHVC